MQSVALALLPEELYSLGLNLQRKGQQTLYLLFLVNNMILFAFLGWWFTRGCWVQCCCFFVLDCFVAHCLQVEAGSQSGLGIDAWFDFI